MGKTEALARIVLKGAPWMLKPGGVKRYAAQLAATGMDPATADMLARETIRRLKRYA